MSNILVIGDQCIDRYHYGVCERISPEAPVLILKEKRTEDKFGMALNVYHNLLSFGHNVFKIVSDKRNIKHRYVDQNYNSHLLRVDEGEEGFASNFDKNILNKFNNFDLVIISDYNKGFLSIDDICYICDYFKSKDIKVFIDTKKTKLSEINGAIIKINKKEHDLLESFPEKSQIIITLGSDGAMFEGKVFPTEKVEVFDPCGAGDVFLAALASRYLKTKSIEESIPYANKLASYSATKMGTYVILKEDLDDICI